MTPSRPTGGPARLAMPERHVRIPQHGHGPSGPAPVQAFAIAHRIPVVLFALDRPSLPRSPVRRGWLSLVAGLPLFVLPVTAGAAPPQLPDESPAAEPSPSTDESPSPTVAPPVTTPAADPQTTAPVVAPTARPQPSKVDAAWDGVVGYDVVVSLADGTTLKGRVSAVHRDTFTLIDLKGGGVVRVYDKADVESLRVAVPEPLPSQDGTGMLAGGGILTTIGAPVFIAGVVFLAIYPSGTFLNLPLLLTGGPALGAGIGLLVVGSKRRRAYREAQSKRLTYAPVVGRTRLGTWTGGLSLRF